MLVIISVLLCMLLCGVGVLFCVFWVFIADKTDGVGDKRSRDTTMVDVQTL
jgi:hypothetical protein